MAEPKPAQDTKPATAGDQQQRQFASDAGVEEVIGQKPLNSYFTTLMHLAKCYVGTGIFAMGLGFKDTGLLLGPLFLLMLAIMNLNCQHILISTTTKIAIEAVGDVKPTFAETVEYTMEASIWKWLQNHASKLGWLTNIFLCCCELGFCSVYFVFITEHLLAIADNNGFMDASNPLNKHLMLALILFPMWASTFLGNLKLLMPLSVIANLLMWAGIAIIFYYTSRSLPPVSERKMVAPIAGWPIFFGIALFAFEGITFVIPLRNEMKKPEQFVSLFGVLNVGMCFVFLLFFIVGFLGYWKWGDKVQGSVFLNLTEEDNSMSDAIDAIMSIAVLFTFTLHMYIPFEVTFPLFYRRYGPFKHGVLISIIYRSAPVLFTYLMANIIPFLSSFISLVGSTCGSFLALIMPPFLELMTQYHEMSILRVIKDIIIMTVGIAGAITGTVLSIVEIVEKFQEYGQNNKTA